MMKWNWLPAFIIDKLKEIERQREEKFERERPVLHVPPPHPPEYVPQEDAAEEPASRGSIIIDMNTYEEIDMEF
jgi:hypothetical protein